MRTVMRFVWAGTAAGILGLAIAWAVVGFVVADAYGTQKAIDFQRGGAASEYDWDTLTEDPFVDSLFNRVWAASGLGLFFAFTVPFWDRPAAPADGVRVRPLPPAAEVRTKDTAAPKAEPAPAAPLLETGAPPPVPGAATGPPAKRPRVQKTRKR